MPRLIPPVVAAGSVASSPPPVIQGDGVVLRPWEPGDASMIVAAYADPAIQHWHFRRCDGPEEAHAWRDDLDAARFAERSVNWAVVRSATPAHDPIGRIALHLDLAGGRAEMSYWVVPEARGQGVAVRAVDALVVWSFDELGLHRLEIQHSVMNLASCRVAERAGFAAEGTRRSALVHDDGWHDLHVHGRVRNSDRRVGFAPTRVELRAWTPRWADDFEAIATALRSALGDVVVAIDHIGSTSIGAGMPAKDVIDVQVRVRSLDPRSSIIDPLAAAGYELRPGDWNARDHVPAGWHGDPAAWDKLVFASPAVGRPANIHVRVVGSPNARSALLFRDYLRADDRALASWGVLKSRLADRVEDLAAYGQVKDPATDIVLIAAEQWATQTGWIVTP